MPPVAETFDPLSSLADAHAGDSPSRPWRGLSRSTQALVAAVSIATAGGGGYWYTQRGLESTDNATVDAEVVSVPARISGTVAELRFHDNQRVHAGDVLAVLDDAPARARLAQAEANLAAAEAVAEAAEADALVVSTNAHSNKALATATLRTSQVGANTAEDQVREAEAGLHAAEAQLAQADSDRARATQLLAQGAFARSSFDQAFTAHALARSNLEAATARLTTLRSAANQAQSRIGEAAAKLEQARDIDSLVAQALARARSAHAQVATARAARDLAALDLSYTRILAPADGVASKKTISVGQNVSLGQPIAQLVTAERWITANFKETQVETMRPGQTVKIALDAFPDLTLTGKVESLSEATGSRFTLLPPDNASGNFTKVVQRVPVRIDVVDLPHGVELRPGMSVELTVNTRG